MENDIVRDFQHWILKICPAAVFFFNDTATTEIYTLSLHDALPISKEGTLFKDLPDTWTCPVCNAPKSSFEPVA